MNKRDISFLLDKYLSEFCDLPSGDSWIGCPWGDETTYVGYAYQGVEIFLKYVSYRLWEE